MAKANPNDRATIQALRLSIREVIETLESRYWNSTDQAISILQAAYDNTDPEILDKDCGCGS
jgi:hypothetical protein